MNTAIRHISDYRNPFVALGLVHNELAYSSAIANLLFRSNDYLDALSRRLGLTTPLRFLKHPVATEVSLAKAERLDVMARDDAGRVVIVETKVRSPIDRKQQERYRKEARNQFKDLEIIFLAFKLGPAPSLDGIEDFRVIRARDILDDLPPGDFLGLRGMLEFFALLDERATTDPGVLLKSQEPIDRLLLAHFRDTVYHRLFESFRAQVVGLLPEGQAVGAPGKASRGSYYQHYYDQRWYDVINGTQVHFELKDNDRIALHVETLNYGSKLPQQLARKAQLAPILREAVKTLHIERLEIPNLRKSYAKEESTTIATLLLDITQPVDAARDFARVYRACHPVITALAAR